MAEHFKKLVAPYDFKSYYTAYPEGLTIFEALLNWLDEVNKMIDTLNITLEEWENLKTWINGELKNYAQEQLVEWLNDGTLDDLINEVLFNSKLDVSAFETYKVAQTTLDNQLQAQITTLDNTKLDPTDLVPFERFKLESYNRYGKIDFSQFTGLVTDVAFDVWRDNDGLIKHNFVLDTTGRTTYYVSSTGVDTRDGLTPETAVNRFEKALDLIEGNSSVNKATIKFLGNTVRRSLERGAFTYPYISKDILIEAEKPISTRQSVTWSVYDAGLSVYSAPCPYVVQGVVAINQLDYTGVAETLMEVTSLTECLATKSSFYSDGATIYVRRGGVTDENTAVVLSQTAFQLKLGPSGKVALNDVTIFSSTNGQSCYFDSDSLVGEVILNKVKVKQLNSRTRDLTTLTTNGISTNGVKSIKLFDCAVFNIGRDGFNYHSTRVAGGGGSVFEYNCYGESTGLQGETANNNISTAHDGISIIRINTKGRKSRGPLIADVNGCMSVNIGCSVEDTGLSSSGIQNAAYWFDDSLVSGVITNANGKAWLIDCEGGIGARYGLSGDESFQASGKITVRNSRLINVNSDLNLVVES